MKRNVLLGITLLFFAMGAYKAWEEQYEKAESANQSSDQNLHQTHEYRNTIDKLTIDLVMKSGQQGLMAEGDVFASQTITNFDGGKIILDYEPIPHSISLYFLSSKGELAEMLAPPSVDQETRIIDKTILFNSPKHGNNLSVQVNYSRKLTTESPNYKLKKEALILTDELFDSANNWKMSSNKPSESGVTFNSRFRERILIVWHELDKEGQHSQKFDDMCKEASSPYTFSYFNPSQVGEMAIEIKTLANNLK